MAEIIVLVQDKTNSPLATVWVEMPCSLETLMRKTGIENPYHPTLILDSRAPFRIESEESLLYLNNIAQEMSEISRDIKPYLIEYAKKTGVRFRDVLKLAPKMLNLTKLQGVDNWVDVAKMHYVLTNTLICDGENIAIPSKLQFAQFVDIDFEKYAKELSSVFTGILPDIFQAEDGSFICLSEALCM